MRVNLDQNEKNVTSLKWGVKPYLFPTVKDYRSDAPEIIISIDFSREALSNLKAKMVFPHIFVESILLMWHCIQRATMHPSNYDGYGHDVLIHDPNPPYGVGFFEEPNWDRVAQLDSSSAETLLRTLIRLCLDAYDKTWLLLINKRKKKLDNKEKKMYRPFQNPIQNVTDCLGKSPYIHCAWDGNLPASVKRNVTREDKIPLRKMSKSIL